MARDHARGPIEVRGNGMVLGPILPPGSLGHKGIDSGPMSARFLLVWFTVVLAASFGSRAELRGLAGARCALDGRAIGPAERVELEDAASSPSTAAESSRSFCGVECALSFAAREPSAGPRRFVVRDARDGSALDSRAATFVREGRRPGAVEGRERWRAFRDAASAALYARSAGGLCTPDPFAGHTADHSADPARQNSPQHPR
jgi:hypothetical protein